jgi:uncharacterized Zn finger protein
MGYQTIAWACKKCRVANQHNIKINKSEAVQASFDCRHCGAIGPDVTLLVTAEGVRAYWSEPDPTSEGSRT